MGSNEGRACVSLGGVGHVEPSEGFFGLTLVISKNNLSNTIYIQNFKINLYV